MKVIFLDIDGVMNSAEFYKRKKAQSWEWAHMFGKYLSYSIDPDKVAFLNKIIDATGAVVVLSSSWRLGPPVPALKEDFKRVGIDVFDRCPCWGKYGVTDWKVEEDENGHPYTTLIPRSEIVGAWLKDHPEVERYVIIDDNDQFTDEQHKYLVLTNEEVGLTEENVQTVINILNS